MSRKALKTWYWIVTILFVGFMLFSGISELMGLPSANAILERLGYPLYLNYILGIAKILGPIAIIQTKWDVIKEWAYAGFTIDFIGATLSFAFIGATFVETVMPLLFLGVMFISYGLWKKLS